MIFVNTKEDWEKLKVKTRYNFICKECKKETTLLKRQKEFDDSFFLCMLCKRRKSNLEKYGVPEVRMLKEVQEKCKQTWKNKSEEEKQKFSEDIAKRWASLSENDKNKIAEKITKRLKERTKEEWEETDQKRRSTLKEKYGNANFRNREKAKTTCEEKYGNEFYNNREKAEQTCIKNFGVKNIMQSSEMQNHFKEVWAEKSEEEKEKIIQKGKKKKEELYGNENYNNDEKRRATNLKKHGKENFTNVEKRKETWKNKSSEEKQNWKNKLKENAANKKEEDWEKILEKRRKTLIERYGNDNLNFAQFYRFDEITFDSSWELAVWIWAKDNGKIIKREPCYFEYSALGKNFRYYPDFEIEGEYVEVKGDQFFDEKGNLINPWKSTDPEILKNKQLCMEKNKVKVWKQKEIDEILKTFIWPKYGKNFLGGFKIVKTSKC